MRRFALLLLLAVTALASPPQQVLLSLKPAAGGSFAPSDLANLVQWYKADTLALSDGAAVTSWTDSSGGGHTAAQATGGQQPTYKAAILNSKPVVRFDGADDQLTGTVTYSGTTMTAFAVLKLSADNAFQRVLSFNTTTADDYAVSTSAAAILQLGSVGIGSYRNPDGALSTATISTGTFYIVAIKFDGAHHTTYLNSVAQTAVSNSGTFGVTNFVLGDYQTTGGSPFTGDIAEIIVYSAALSDANRNSVEDYLSARYGITVTH